MLRRCVRRIWIPAWRNHCWIRVAIRSRMGTPVRKESENSNFTPSRASIPSAPGFQPASASFFWRASGSNGKA